MMKDIIHYSYLKIKYFFRLRKSRGFGIHSPFVFHLVTQVIKGKHLFYVFDLLDDAFSKYNYRDVKYAKIVYRIINDLNIKFVYCKSKSFACDRLICDNADLKYNFIDEIGMSTEAYKVIYAGDDDLVELLKEETIASFKKSKTLVVLNEMYKCDKTLNAYLSLKDECNMSIDMFYRGLLFFDEKLQKGEYSIKI